MSREKQIEEMSTLIYENRPIKDIWNEDADSIAETLYNAGYRKQKDAKWVDNHCTACGMTPIGEEIWTKCDLTPPKFEWFMDYCPCCGAKMKGGVTAESAIKAVQEAAHELKDTPPDDLLGIGSTMQF